MSDVRWDPLTERRQYVGVLLQHPKFTDADATLTLLKGVVKVRKSNDRSSASWLSVRFDFLADRNYYRSIQGQTLVADSRGNFAHPMFIFSRGDERWPKNAVLLMGPVSQVMDRIVSELSARVGKPSLKVGRFRVEALFEDLQRESVKFDVDRIVLQPNESAGIVDFVSLSGKKPLQATFLKLLSEISTAYGMRAKVRSDVGHIRVNFDKSGKLRWYTPKVDMLTSANLFTREMCRLGYVEYQYFQGSPFRFEDPDEE